MSRLQSSARLPYCLSVGLSAVLFLSSGWLASCEIIHTADLILVNGRVYTFSWDEPATDGTPAANAPLVDGTWHPDAEAIAARDGRILYVGSNDDVWKYQGPTTDVIDVDGATILPGLIDSHVHIAGLGANLERVNLVGLDTEAEAVDMVAERAATVPEGEWIIGWGWDEGAWADDYPTMQLLSRRVPNHPVYLSGLHGFAAWGNELAFERAGITSATEDPDGGQILRDRSGSPTGVLVNRAVALLEAAVPPVTQERLESRVEAGLTAMAEAGYVAVHEAGAASDLMRALEQLNAEGRLPIRVYPMLAARDEELLRDWETRGPDSEFDGMLMTRAVKAFYDGALGSRGAGLLDDYSDRPGHRGVSGDEYGFNQDIVEDMIAAGFQVSIHAIGDAANRATLDFLERAAGANSDSPDLRHRIAHAQVVHPNDTGRFAELHVIASMQPAHAVEDKGWAEDRLGPERVKHAYAWRSLRQAGARLTFNSDLPGSDYNIFYGLHSAITRRDRASEPQGGWYPEQVMTPEEAIRGYTIWAAYSSFLEDMTGTLESGKWADITVIDVDPLVMGSTDPGSLLDGSILLTIVNGEAVFRSERDGSDSALAR
ncbi:MAG: amidohydrolase [Gemmatimonadales bacterium]|jgi:predicted amidohydrolase YtcJ